MSPCLTKRCHSHYLMRGWYVRTKLFDVLIMQCCWSILLLQLKKIPYSTALTIRFPRCWTSHLPFATFCRMKWKSTSICFVRAWNKGLADKYVALKLSHHNITGRDKWISNSRSNEHNHITSVIWAKTQYSESVENLANVFFLASRLRIRLVPRKIAKSSIDLRSSWQPT